ncbi:MAG TPA: AI-2E family transporter [Lachnospiraceae bacterium]|nr:AI-2E family transporter [Lachnospiraceae bacterium]
MGHFDKRYIKIGILGVICTCICIGFYFLMKNGAESLFYLKNRAINILLPFIDAIVIAFILNPVMMSLETRVVEPLFKKIKGFNPSRNLCRGVSILLSLILFFLIVIGLISLIVPQLIESIQSIILRMPSYLSSLNNMLSDLLRNNKEIDELFNTYSVRLSDYLTREIIPTIQSFISSLSGTIFSSVFVFFSGALKFIIGIIICTYLLYKKEIYLAQAKKTIYAYCSPERANDIINNLRFANRTFGGFLTGKLFDSLIIGILCFICISIMRIPYALLISCVVGVTNIIPYFGPFLGAVPSALILLMIDPMKSIIFAVFILILQQVDGNIIGPKILGDSTGLPGIWVIFSITIFGGIFGVFGMVIAVPIFSIIYAAFKANLESKLKKKNMPSDTDFYIRSDYYPENMEESKRPEMSGEHFRLKNGAVSENIQRNRNKKKPD